MAIPRRGLAVAAAIAVVAASIAFVAARSGKPEALSELDRAQRSAGAASREADKIIASLDRIASNLEGAAELPHASAEIQDLTQQQRRSLEELAGLLKDELDSIATSSKILEGTKRSSAGLAATGRRQNAILAEAVAALERVREFAASAAGISAQVARQALYGARLAEDSERSFRNP